MIKLNAHDLSKKEIACIVPCQRLFINKMNSRMYRWLYELLKKNLHPSQRWWFLLVFTSVKTHIRKKMNDI